MDRRTHPRPDSDVRRLCLMLVALVGCGPRVGTWRVQSSDSDCAFIAPGDEFSVAEDSKEWHLVFADYQMLCVRESPGLLCGTTVDFDLRGWNLDARGSSTLQLELDVNAGRDSMSGSMSVDRSCAGNDCETVFPDSIEDASCDEMFQAGLLGEQ